MRRHYVIITGLIAFLTIAGFSISDTFGSPVEMPDEDEWLQGKHAGIEQFGNGFGQITGFDLGLMPAYDPATDDANDKPADEIGKSSSNSGNNDNTNPEVASGYNSVGDYFEIDQETSTSGGTTRRHNDISSPWSGAYVYENTTIVGKAEITDSFRMDNIKPGTKAESDWWDTF